MLCFSPEAMSFILMRQAEKSHTGLNMSLSDADGKFNKAVSSIASYSTTYPGT